MESFQEIMQQAVKIKDAQMKSMRTRFDAWPSFMQNTLFPDKAHVEFRTLPYAERLLAASRLKEKGNALFKEKKWDEAQKLYEQAVGVFYYAENKNSNWKKEGLNDHDITIVNFQGDTEEEKAELKAFKATCFNNMATVQYRIPNYDLCIEACTYCLEIDPTHVKALYRRAVARIEDVKSGAVAADMAKKDLKRALELDPENKNIQIELKKLSKELSYQKARDKKNFTKMFDRGSTMYRDKEKGSELTKVTSKEEPVDPGAKLANELYQAEMIANFLEKKGRKKQATKLRNKINETKEKGQYKYQGPDFLNPTTEMIEDAKKHGIDMTNPLIQKYMQELEERKKKGLPLDDESIEKELMGEDVDKPKDKKNLNQKFVWGLTFIFLMWRFWTAGVFGWIWQAMEGDQSLAANDADYPFDMEQEL